MNNVAAMPSTKEQIKSAMFFVWTFSLVAPAIIIYLWQIYYWLRFGAWMQLSIIQGLIWLKIGDASWNLWLVYGDTWKGVHSIFKFLSVPGGLIFVYFVSLLIRW